MKIFICKLTVFLFVSFAILTIYFVSGAKLATLAYGVCTQEQIVNSFEYAKQKHFNKVFLGNSRVYRGINPDIIDKSTYNFAHDNDSYNQCYYKLVYLLYSGHKIDTLFLGADYFEFGIKSGTRNYVYDKLFDGNYYKDYNKDIVDEIIANGKQVLYNNQLLCVKAFFSILRPNGAKGILKENGQYIYDSKASINDSVKREMKVLDFQYDYYLELIKLCHKNNITVIVFTMPVRDSEMSSYTKEYISKIHKLIVEPLIKDDRYFDLSDVEEFKDYHKYTDITHLNSKAADEFTDYFWKRINNKQYGF